MGIKKESKQEITRILEENFDFILNTQDSILNLEKILSTENQKVSMYQINTFMNKKGYRHDKITKAWILINEPNTSNCEYNKSQENSLNQSEFIFNNNENSSMTDDLKDFLKQNSNKKEDSISDENTSNSEETKQEIKIKSTLENISENSLIPEENIIKEIWKITNNTASNFEVVIKHLLSLSKQLSENTLLLSSINANNEINNTNYFKIPSNQMIDIIHGDTKRYELTLVINFVDAIKQKFFLKHPDITGFDKLKDTKILSMALLDYLVSN